MERRN